MFCHRACIDYHRSIFYLVFIPYLLWSDLFRRVRIDGQKIIRLSIHQCVEIESSCMRACSRSIFNSQDLLPEP